jgi:regulator of PEP synthase PpsR (kinase-PPPase family)
MSLKRTVFFISDRTGITTEMLGHSLLAQFESVEFQQHTLPFIDSPEKAREVVKRIEQAAREDGVRPLVFSTLIGPDIRDIVATGNALFIDLFSTFIDGLEAELGVPPSHAIGLSHRVGNAYSHRIEAINYTLNHDDGTTIKSLDQSDIIILGVSRSGKTPTCLYLALQFGIQAANYPLTPDDDGRIRFPAALLPYRHKLYGLTIAAERLREIRNERRPDSRYASLENCRDELRQVEELYRRENIRYLDTTSKSIEEISTTIMQEVRLSRRLF